MTDQFKEDFEAGVRESVSEAFPGFTKAAHEMVVGEIMTALGDGMDKEAAAGKAAYRTVKDTWAEAAKTGTRSLGGDLKEAAAMGAVRGLVGVGVGALAGTTIHNFLKAKRNEELINQYAQFQGTLSNVSQRNEVLANENKERIQELGNSIFNFAPTVANDPLVLETVMSNAVHGGGLDPQTVRSLQELEERYHKLRDVEAPKTYIVS